MCESEIICFENGFKVINCLVKLFGVYCSCLVFMVLNVFIYWIVSFFKCINGIF